MFRSPQLVHLLWTLSAYMFIIYKVHGYTLISTYHFPYLSHKFFLTFNVRSAPTGIVMSMVVVAEVHRFVQSGIKSLLAEARANSASRSECPILFI
jgi:hypothetical protein